MDVDEMQDQFDQLQPPRYESYPDNQNIFLQYEQAQGTGFRLSSHTKREPYQINIWDWVLAVAAGFFCLACGIPAIVYVFSAYKDTQEERIIEAKKKIKAGRLAAVIGIAAGITIMVISIILAAVYAIVYVALINAPTDPTTITNA